MDVVVSEEPIATLAEHGRVPIAFRVESVVDVAPRAPGRGGFDLLERRLDAPYLKDYDALAGGGPAGWAERFDVSRWGLIAARVSGERVGGAVVAWDTPGVDMLRGRRDLAVLWDLRVAPHVRGRGVGSALFRAAEAWAVARGCRRLEVETQDVNVPACRFYARQGCVLAAVDRHAYADLPGETQLLWGKDLNRPSESRG